LLAIFRAEIGPIIAMTNQAVCPACQLSLQLPDSLPGRTLQCPRCGSVLVTAPHGQLVIQRQPAKAANPFADYPAQAPYGPAAFQPGFYGMPVMTREAALAKVRGPAIMLQIAGGLCIVSGAGLPLLLLTPDLQNDEVALVMLPCAAALAAAVGIFIVFCGWRMKNLRSYMLVMASVIMLMLMGLLICPLAAVPGIWPLVVLLDYGVKMNFNAAKSAGQSPFREP
jgi:hypothetical protein